MASGNEKSPEDFEAVIEKLRALALRASQEHEVRLGPSEAALLEAAVRGLEGVPHTMQEAMHAAFQMGREHGRKEELLKWLERENMLESERLARQAWGKWSPLTARRRHS